VPLPKNFQDQVPKNYMCCKWYY